MIGVSNGEELKKKLLKGINNLSNAVSSTLGPSGRNVLLRGDDGEIKITKDGVTVAKSFKQLEDPIEDIGAQLIRKVSERAVDKAGDGTTTATLLAATMINEGIKLINNGSNPVEVKRGIDLAVKTVITRLKSISTEIRGQAQVLQVATLSGNNDPVVGELIATSLEKVGNDGVVAIENSKTGETSQETVEGMMFDRGYSSIYFVTNQTNMTCVMENPYILLIDGKLNSSKQIVPILQVAHTKNKALVIVADEIGPEALAIMVVNKVQQGLKICAVKAPDFGDRKTASLEDMAVLTGGTVLSSAKGHKLDKISAAEYEKFFGECRLITVSSKDTTLVDGFGDKEAIGTRLVELKEQCDNAKSPFEIENIQNRISKMTGGVAIIHVGGQSEVEMLEMKDRVDDALHATKAALLEGIVPGGGMALINCESALDDLKLPNRDQMMGVAIVRKALYAPFIKILQNAGIENYYKVLAEINSIIEGTPEEQDRPWQGYNVKTETYGDLKLMGVIDPTKVTRTAIENAASIAGIFLTTENSVYTLPEDKKETTQDFSNYM